MTRSPVEHGQAQPLASALAASAKVLCCLMLMLLPGAVAVASIFRKR
jgi:hypothetical protein